MNTVVGRINSIHENCDHTWLTPSQASVYEMLQSGFVHQRILNVFGGVGVGKTVLGWVLERERYAVYCPDDRSLPFEQRRVIIDNCTSSRKVRKLIDDMDDLRIGQALIITQRRIDDDFPAFEVVLTPDDVRSCKATLWQKLSVCFYAESEYRNLHDLVRSAT